MTPRLQTFIALFIVVLAAAGLVWSAFSRRKRPGCGGGCGCPGDEFKAAGFLKRPPAKLRK